MTSKASFDFTKVEALRKHMLLTATDMSELLGVSRMTYYGWVRGKPIRKTNEAKAKTMLRRLLAVMQEFAWPAPDVIAMEQKQRKAKLLELLDQLQ
jgi:DNA-binding XRE family transcriptional regulator